MRKEKNKVLFNYHALDVKVERQPGGELLSHLKSTVLGTPGGIRYRHLHTEEKLKHLGEIYFLLLRKSDRMLGSIGLCSRDTIFSGKKYSSWYVRYFAIKGAMRFGNTGVRSSPVQPGRGMSLLRNAVYPYLQKPGENLKAFSPGSEKSLVYAYIEKKNHQSMQFAEQNDFETVRQFTTYMLSRFFPRKDKNVFKIMEEEKRHVRKQLETFYSNHTLYMDENLFYRDDFYVYKSGGRIVAGMQANPDGWEIKEMGGKTGKFIISFFPYIPGINRVFNPRKMNFIAGDYIFWEDGYEKVLPGLIESACKIHNVNIFMTWSDTRGRLIRSLDKHVKLGLIGKIIKRVDADIKVKFNGFGAKEKEVFYANPSFISSFDVT